MKILTHPITGKQFKMGRKRPATPHGRSSLRDMLKACVLPNVSVPATTHYADAASVALANIYGNDALGDCVIAGGQHVRGVTSFNSRQGVIFTDEQTIQQYSAIGGYDPNAPLVDGQNPTDDGCDENTALTYWETTGFADGVLLENAVTVDASNPDEINLAVYLFENVYFGMELPDAWVNSMPSASGFVWDVAGDPDPDNGHCVVGVDRASNGILIDSWGMTGVITYPAIEKYASESGGGQLFTLLTPDIISRITQKSPAGYDNAALLDYLKQL